MRQSPQSIDLRSAGFKDNPVPTWHRLQQQGAVVTTRQKLLGRIAFATTHQAAQAVLKDDKRFSVDARTVGETACTGLRWWVPSGYQQLADNMLTHDADEHKRLRRAVDHAFRRTSLAAVEPVIKNLAETLVATMGKHRHADWVSAVARPLPRDVISGILGFDQQFCTDRKRFDAALARLSSVSGVVDLFRVMPALSHLKNALRREIDERRRRPSDDLLGQLIPQATSTKDSAGADPLDDAELLSTAFLLYTAGHETTTHLLSSALLTILREPGVREALPHPVTRQAVIELLRHTGPVQFSKPRFVVEDMNFEGVELHRGETISALVAAAGHDPAWTSEPQRVDFDRRTQAPLGFGGGPHHCLGQHLALSETAIVLTALFDRFPQVKLHNATQQPAWTPRFGLRSLQRLELCLY